MVLISGIASASPSKWEGWTRPTRFKTRKQSQNIYPRFEHFSWGRSGVWIPLPLIVKEKKKPWDQSSSYMSSKYAYIQLVKCRSRSENDAHIKLINECTTKELLEWIDKCATNDVHLFCPDYRFIRKWVDDFYAILDWRNNNQYCWYKSWDLALHTHSLTHSRDANNELEVKLDLTAPRKETE